ncbi:MAG: hypothetical protein K6B28_07365 [Lachnospiraceae bacterium]|nr:hypothetical protein [Lachnospiraceae bacterium]
MIAFINTFLSYVIVVIVFMAIIVCAVMLGKKLRDMKDAKKQEAEEAGDDVTRQALNK